MGKKMIYAFVCCIACALSCCAYANSYTADKIPAQEETCIETKNQSTPLANRGEQFNNHLIMVENTRQEGDLNRDGTVDFSDLAILKHFTRQPLGMCPECDLDKDNEITSQDAKTLTNLCTFSHYNPSSKKI